MSLDELVAALDDADSPSRSTSVRQPTSLQRALKAAVALGFASTPNEGQNISLRTQLEAFAQRLALEEHFTRFPDSRPTLSEVALELARIDHDPLADEPELIERAAEEILEYRPDADGDDVLVWAASMRRHRVAG